MLKSNVLHLGYHLVIPLPRPKFYSPPNLPSSPVIVPFRLHLIGSSFLRPLFSSSPLLYFSEHVLGLAIFLFRYLCLCLSEFVPCPRSPGRSSCRSLSAGTLPSLLIRRPSSTLSLPFSLCIPLQTLSLLQPALWLLSSSGSFCRPSVAFVAFFAFFSTTSRLRQSFSLRPALYSVTTLHILFYKHAVDRHNVHCTSAIATLQLGPPAVLRITRLRSIASPSVQ